MASRRYISLLAIICVGAVLTFILPTRGQEDQKDTSSLEGKQAPDFSLKTLDGKDFKLSALQGDVVVLDFWATWCPPCRKSLPHLQAVSTNDVYAKNGLKVFAVNAKEDEDKVKGFLKENKYTFTVPMDGEGKAMQQYMVRGIPTTVIVGRTGKVSKVFIGYGGDESAKQIDEAVEAALKEAKPAV